MRRVSPFPKKSTGTRFGSAPVRRLFRLLKPHSAAAVFTLLFSAGSVVFTLLFPVEIGRAVDAAAGAGKVDFIALASHLLRAGLFALCAGILQWIQRLISQRTAFRMVRDLRNDAFRKIQTLPFRYLDGHPSGDVVSRVINDAEQLSDGLLLGFSQLFSGIATIVGTLILMILLRPGVALAVAVLTPLSLFAAKFITSRTRRYFKEQSEAAGAETAFLNEAVSHQKTVKAFGREKAQTEAFGALNRRLHASSLRAVFFSSLTNPSTRFVNSLVYAAVALIGALLCLSGTPGLTGTALTVGGLTALLSYANQYMKPFNEISAVMAETQNALVCAGRLFEFLDEPEESPDVSAESNPDPERKGTVAFDSVSFSYDPDRPLIQNLNLEFPPGCRAAIVGPTGCGKTTLINLFMRFYDVDAGAVRVDGTDVREMRRGDLRARYGMVLQDTWLKRGTVRENLLLGRPDATEDEMIAAAEAAHADSFIRVLPDGYDTFLEENGGSLSQGQKQLLCIARVFLCRPPMLILDEATSSIDSRTELRIQSAFSRLTEGRTSFIVAHRLSTVRSSDVILVMRDGTVVERGTHGELLEKNGFYAGLYRSQFEIPED